MSRSAADLQRQELSQQCQAGLLWPSGLLLILHEQSRDMPAAVTGCNQPANLLWAGLSLLGCGASMAAPRLGSETFRAGCC